MDVNRQRARARSNRTDRLLSFTEWIFLQQGDLQDKHFFVLPNSSRCPDVVQVFVARDLTKMVKDRLPVQSFEISLI